MTEAKVPASGSGPANPGLITLIFDDMPGSNVRGIGGEYFVWGIRFDRDGRYFTSTYYTGRIELEVVANGVLTTAAYTDTVAIPVEIVEYFFRRVFGETGASADDAASFELLWGGIDAAIHGSWLNQEEALVHQGAHPPPFRLVRFHVPWPTSPASIDWSGIAEAAKSAILQSRINF